MSSSTICCNDMTDLCAAPDRVPRFTSNKTFECDYDINPTHLYQAIERREWISILEYFQTGRWPDILATTLFSNEDPDPPERQARTWVTRYCDITKKEIEWSRLPLHVAINMAAPYHIVEQLLILYPDSIRCADDQRMLPIHYALRHGSDDDVIRLLVEQFPAGTSKMDMQGHLPFQLGGPRDDRRKTIELFVLAAERKHKHEMKQLQAQLDERSDQAKKLRKQLNRRIPLPIPKSRGLCKKLLCPFTKRQNDEDLDAELNPLNGSRTITSSHTDVPHPTVISHNANSISSLNCFKQHHEANMRSPDDIYHDEYYTSSPNNNFHDQEQQHYSNSLSSLNCFQKRQGSMRSYDGSHNNEFKSNPQRGYVNTNSQQTNDPRMVWNTRSVYSSQPVDDQIYEQNTGSMVKMMDDSSIVTNEIPHNAYSVPRQASHILCRNNDVEVSTQLMKVSSGSKDEVTSSVVLDPSRIKGYVHSASFEGSSSQKPGMVDQVQPDYRQPETHQDYRQSATQQDYRQSATQQDYRQSATQQNYRQSATQQNYRVPNDQNPLQPSEMKGRIRSASWDETLSSSDPTMVEEVELGFSQPGMNQTLILYEL